MVEICLMLQEITQSQSEALLPKGERGLPRFAPHQTLGFLKYFPKSFLRFHARSHLTQRKPASRRMNLLRYLDARDDTATPNPSELKVHLKPNIARMIAPRSKFFHQLMKGKFRGTKALAKERMLRILQQMMGKSRGNDAGEILKSKGLAQLWPEDKMLWAEMAGSDNAQYANAQNTANSGFLSAKPGTEEPVFVPSMKDTSYLMEPAVKIAKVLYEDDLHKASSQEVQNDSEPDPNESQISPYPGKSQLGMWPKASQDEEVDRKQHSNEAMFLPLPEKFQHIMEQSALGSAFLRDGIVRNLNEEDSGNTVMQKAIMPDFLSNSKGFQQLKKSDMDGDRFLQDHDVQRAELHNPEGSQALMIPYADDPDSREFLPVDFEHADDPDSREFLPVDFEHPKAPSVDSIAAPKTPGASIQDLIRFQVDVPDIPFEPKNTNEFTSTVSHLQHINTPDLDSVDFSQDGTPGAAKKMSHHELPFLPNRVLSNRPQMDITSRMNSLKAFIPDKTLQAIPTHAFMKHLKQTPISNSMSQTRKPEHLSSVSRLKEDMPVVSL